MFSHTLDSLTALESKLKCKICDVFVVSPVTLGGCEHIFCSGCCQEYLGGCCPICEIPAQAKDADVDRMLFNMASLCSQLREVVETSAIETGSPQSVTDIADDGEQEPEKVADLCSDIKSTIQYPVPSEDSTSACRKKTKARPSRARKSEDEDTENTKPNRKILPIDQKTMTQFSDHTDDRPEVDLDENELSKNSKETASKNRPKKGTAKLQKRASTRLRHSLDGSGQDRKGVNSDDVCESVNTTDAKIVAKDRGGKQEDDDGPKLKKKRRGKAGETLHVDNKEVETLMSSCDQSGRGSLRSCDKAKVPLTSRPALKTVGHQKLGRGTGSQSPKTTKKMSSDERSKVTIGTPSPRSNVRSRYGRNGDKTQLSNSGHNTPVGKSKQAVQRASTPVLNKRNAKGETPLQVAALKNDVGKVEELLTSGANPNVRDNAGWTPLHEACNHGYVDVARLLLDYGAMMNVPGLDNDTPLHDAISNNRVDCVKLLVSRGASLTARNLQGLTPTDLATSKVMKAAIETPLVSDGTDIQSEPVDTIEYQAPCLLGTGLSREEKIVLQKAVSQLHVKLADDFSPEVTHVVTRCNQQGLCPRTVKLLQAMLMGRWILTMEWLETCMQMGSLVCEEAFEVQGLSLFPEATAPHDARINRKQQLPGLFDGCHFYFHGTFEYATPSKDDLIAVVKCGGGKLLSREPKPGHLDGLPLTVPYHADCNGQLAHCSIFIIHETSVAFQPIRTKYLCSVPATWIMDSAAKFRLQSLPDQQHS